MINTIIGKYKLLRLIGEGGMASVYEAEHEILATRVAIKVLNPILSANSQIRERFTNEAKMMASLNHPNIIKVIDFDEQPHQLSTFFRRHFLPLNMHIVKELYIEISNQPIFIYFQTVRLKFLILVLLNFLVRAMK